TTKTSATFPWAAATGAKPLPSTRSHPPAGLILWVHRRITVTCRTLSTACAVASNRTAPSRSDFAPPSPARWRSHLCGRDEPCDGIQSGKRLCDARRAALGRGHLGRTELALAAAGCGHIVWPANNQAEVSGVFVSQAFQSHLLFSPDPFDGRRSRPRPKRPRTGRRDIGRRGHPAER